MNFVTRINTKLKAGNLQFSEPGFGIDVLLDESRMFIKGIWILARGKAMTHVKALRVWFSLFRFMTSQKLRQ